MRKSNSISIENAIIKYRNFSGKAGQYNLEGKRNFCVIINDELAKLLVEDGWNVRMLESKNSNEPDQPYLSVAVSYDNIPPKIIMISSRGKTVLNEETVSLLDWAEISEVDLTITPYYWTMHKGTKGEKSGIKAFVKNMYVTIVEDEFESKYNNTPDKASDTIGGCGNCDACDGSCKCHEH